MGGQCSMCADATSAGLFPSMRGDHQLPLTGYAYLRIADHDLRQEIAKWCSEAVDDGLLAPAGPPGSEDSESRPSADEMHVTIATGITAAALETIQALADQHCPFELQLEQLRMMQDREGGYLVVCIDVVDAPALAALRRDVAALDGVACGDGEKWQPCVVVARVRADTTSHSHQLAELRKEVERNKRIFFHRSSEAAQLVVVLPPAVSQSGGAEPQVTVFELAYKGGGI